MADDIVAGLREIAALLQARIDQTADAAKQAEARMARFELPKPPVPDFAAAEAKHDAEARERRELAARHRDEDLAFRERLLGALDRQNTLLARLVDRLAPE
jgi:hypothetical protein